MNNETKNKKFNRIYELKIEDRKGREYVFTDFYIEFNVKKNINGGSNDSIIILKNLDSNTRELLRKDRTEIQKRLCSLSVGYSSTGIFQVLFGDVFFCKNSRYGVDVNTEIQVIDGGNFIQNSEFNKNYSSGTKYETIINDILEQGKNYNIRVGNIDDDIKNKTLNMSRSFSEKSIQSLNFDGFDTYIENNTLNITKTNSDKKYYNVLYLNELLETPIFYETQLEVKVLLESSIRLNQIVHIESAINTSVNGFWKVNEYNHSGVITRYGTSGEAITTIKLIKV